MRHIAVIGLVLTLFAAPAWAAPQGSQAHRGSGDTRFDRVESIARQLEQASHRLRAEAARRVARADRREVRALSTLQRFEQQAQLFHRQVAHRGGSLPSQAEYRRLADSFRHARVAFDDLRVGHALRGDFRRVRRLVDDLEEAHGLALRDRRGDRDDRYARNDRDARSDRFVRYGRPVPRPRLVPRRAVRSPFSLWLGAVLGR